MPRFPAQKGSQRPDFHPSPLFSSDRFHLPLLMSPYRSPSLFTCLLFGWLSRPTHDPRFKVPLADHLADGANARAHTCVVPSFTLFFSRLLRVDCTLHHCTTGPLASLRSVSLRVLARFSATHSSKPKSTVLRERAFFCTSLLRDLSRGHARTSYWLRTACSPASCAKRGRVTVSRADFS